MFSISYVEGETFDKSFFVGRDGADVHAVKASLVIPKEVQAAILAETPNVIEPEEAIEQIKKSCGNTFEGFKTWASKFDVEEQPELEKQASLEKEAEWAVNEGEIQKVAMPGKGEMITSVKEEEVAAGKKDAPLPSDRPSKIKNYYGRLPGKTVGPEEVSINLQSAIREKYQLLKKAVEEERKKREMTEKELAVTKDENKKLKEEKKVETKTKLIDKIVKELDKQGRIADPEQEKLILDLLSKISEEDLGIVEELVELTAEVKKGKEKETEKGKEAELPMEKIFSSLKGTNLPPLFQEEKESASPIETMSRIWNL
jgi:hypothetical protein